MKHKDIIFSPRDAIWWLCVGIACLMIVFCIHSFLNPSPDILTFEPEPSPTPKHYQPFSDDSGVILPDMLPTEPEDQPSQGGSSEFELYPFHP